MITDSEEQNLADMATSHVHGSRPVEEATVELLYAILTELRTLRKALAPETLE